jgi:phosphoserine phosphatase
MATLGSETMLVSGGFTFFSGRVAEAAGFASNRANVLVVADGHLTGEVAWPILGRRAKLAALEAASARLGIAPGEAVAIGDGANDLDMVRAAGLGVAWRAKPALAEAAAVRLDHSDLTAVLALQGIPQRDWRA